MNFSTKGYELELFIYIRFTDVFVSVSLTEASVSLQNVSKDRNLGATALRPSIAYGMTKMAKLAPGTLNITSSVFYSNMCGTTLYRLFIL